MQLQVRGHIKNFLEENLMGTRHTEGKKLSFIINN